MPNRNRRPNAAAHACAIALVTAGSTVTSLVADAQESASRLEEVIVTSSRIETPLRQLATAVSVLDAENIELRGYSSIADVLRTQPSIGVSNSGGPGKSTSLRIRGEESYRTLLMIDGVKAVDPSAAQVGPSFDSLLTTSDLARVEILRGPQGFIYGADAGGVVNVMTRRGEGPLGGQLGLEYGDFGTRMYNASLFGGNDSGDYFVAITDLDTDGFNAQTADTLLRDDDGAENTTVHTKLGWNATDKLRLQLVARDIEAATQYDGCFDTVTFATAHDCVGETEQTTYRVSAEHATEKFGNAFAYSRVDIFRDNLTEGVSAFSSDGQISRLEYTGSYEPAASTAIVYGVDLQNEKVVSGEAMERDQDGYYVEYQGAFADRFFLSIGARYDDNEDFGSHTSARMSGAYVHDRPGGGAFKYRASIGTGFRPPSLFEISYNERPFGVYPPAAATGLTEEASRGYDLGFEFDGEDGLHFEVTYFDHEIEDQIVYFFDGTTFLDGYIQSSGESTSNGVELAIDAPLGDRWSILANWTNNETETSDGSPRLRRPEDLGNLGLQYASSSERFRFLANYRVSGEAVDFGGSPIDSYEVLDVSMSYAFNENLEFRARVENLADEDYQEVLGYNTAGRAAYAGVSVRF